MRERILAVADRLFYQRGIRAMGVDTIAAEIGISKRTLYNHFPSKDSLIAAYLERRARPAKLSDAPAIEQILGTFDTLEQRFASPEFRGCPFVNAVTELGPEEREVREVAIAFKEGRRLWFRELLSRLRVAAPDGLSLQLAILVDGASAAHLVRGDPAMARAARQAAQVLLARAVDEARDAASAPAATAATNQPPPGETPPGRLRSLLGYLNRWIGRQG